MPRLYVKIYPNYGVVVVVDVVVKREESKAEAIDLKGFSEKMYVFFISLIEQILLFFLE